MNPVPESLEKGEPSDLPDSEELYTVHSEGKKKVFVCQVPDCAKSFKYKSEIFRHVATHSNQRPHTCPFDGCKKSFKRGDALENHIRTHTKDTPFICEFENCGLGFNTKASLRYHILKHQDQKIYQCSFPGCQKAFITSFQLKQHEKSNCVHKRMKVPVEGSSEGVENRNPNISVKKEGRRVQDQDQAMKTEIPPFMKNTALSIPSVWNSKEDNETAEIFEEKVKEILSENQILKRRLDLSQKIIGLLQHQMKYEPLNIPEYPLPEMMTENLFRFQFYNNVDN